MGLFFELLKMSFQDSTSGTENRTFNRPIKASLISFFFSTLLTFHITMPSSTLVEKGYVDVAANGREPKPVNIYFEKHGSGPEHVLLVMGEYSCHTFMHSYI